MLPASILLIAQVYEIVSHTNHITSRMIGISPLCQCVLFLHKKRPSSNQLASQSPQVYRESCVGKGNMHIATINNI